MSGTFGMVHRGIANEMWKRKIIATDEHLQTASQRVLDAMDDLAVGLEQLGEMDQSIAIMRKKIQLVGPIPIAPARQVAASAPFDAERDDLDRILATHLSPQQKQQYSACANLGTILFIECFEKAASGDAAAVGRLKESLDWIERSIAINPYGHFGREFWQAILEEHLLAATQTPELLGKFDFIGDEISEVHVSPFRSPAFGYQYSRQQDSIDRAKISSDQRVNIRGRITPVGGAPGWVTAVRADYQQSMPFDEPVLAMIGMWTMGGGPNPHFALAMGQVMEQVGQGQIAWNAYERAVELSDSFWPDPSVRKVLIDNCRGRQAIIAERESPGQAEQWQRSMRKQHGDELAWGLSYQKAYHEFEDHQIAAGVSLENPKFYDSFFAARPSIASVPGLADDLVVRYYRSATQEIACITLGTGVSMFLVTVWPKKTHKQLPG